MVEDLVVVVVRVGCSLVSGVDDGRDVVGIVDVVVCGVVDVLLDDVDDVFSVDVVVCRVVDVSVDGNRVVVGAIVVDDWNDVGETVELKSEKHNLNCNHDKYNVNICS